VRRLPEVLSPLAALADLLLVSGVPTHEGADQSEGARVSIRSRLRQRMRALTGASYREGDTCPRCGQPTVLTLDAEAPLTLDGCPLCAIAWERETRKNPTGERCDNCAFRPGSKEQANPEEWRTIVEATVKRDGAFYCHKRVPLSVVDIKKGDPPFQFEKGPNGRPTNATLCAGWISAKLAVLCKDEERA
jgi:hypothetical protein